MRQRGTVWVGLSYHSGTPDKRFTQMGETGLEILDAVSSARRESIVKTLEPLSVINWNDVRPWIAMLGGVILFLGWELRKKRGEIQKLDLEIAQMRSQQSLVRVATMHEMNLLIKDVEEISARNLRILGGLSPREDFGIRFREFLGLRQLRNVCHRNYGPFTVHELFPKPY
jgi:hypothetical protein